MSCDGLIIRIFMTIIGCKGLFFFEVSMTPRQGARLDSHRSIGMIIDVPCTRSNPHPEVWPESRGAPISLISLPHPPPIFC